MFKNYNLLAIKTFRRSLMFLPIFYGYSLQDGYVDLTTANFDRLNLDVIDDLKRLMKMAGGKEKLDYDRFADLMLKTEVQAFLELIYFGPQDMRF